MTIDDEKVVASAATAPPSAPGRDAYEGAREDLLDWKGRALRAESTLRRLGYKGIELGLSRGRSGLRPGGSGNGRGGGYSS